jgi:PilZ domain-containing protein
MAFSGDRRRRKRVPLHWPVRLFRQPGARTVESATENLSSEGFYCISKEPFKRGDRLQCVMVLPGESVGSSEPFLLLQGHVTVTRVEYLASGFGLGCHIEDYALLTGAPPAM